MRWHSDSREVLTWRELDGELVVRSARTGSTHLLQPLASAVLRTLIESDAALSIADLAGRLREDDAAQIEAMLIEFERLGLAEPERP